MYYLSIHYFSKKVKQNYSYFHYPVITCLGALTWYLGDGDGETEGEIDGEKEGEIDADNEAEGDCDGLIDCDDPDCSCVCLPKGAECSSNSNCCSNKCFKGFCK